MRKVFLYKKRVGGKTSDIELSENFALVDDEDYEKVMKYKWFLMKLYHCKSDIQYARRYEYTDRKPKAILLHRFVMDAVDSNTHIDHEDHNGLNCQKSNLRNSTHSQNMSSRRKKINSSSRYLGVHKSNNRDVWRMQTQHNGDTTAMYFRTEKEAALAYNYIAYNNKGAFASLNDIYI